MSYQSSGSPGTEPINTAGQAHFRLSKTETATRRELAVQPRVVHLINDAVAGATLDRAIAEGRKSIALGPSCSSCYGELGEHLMCAGRLPQALEYVEKALRLDPAVYRSDYQFDIASLHLGLGKRDQAVDELRQILIHQPDFTFAHGALAVIYADTGKEAEARQEAAKWLALVKPLTFARIRELARQNDVCVDLPQVEHSLDMLQRLTSAATQSE